MGIISWFINQLMTGGAHPAELMSNHYQSCEIAIFSMRECLSISESTMIYSCQTSQGNVANKYVDQKNGYASTKKDKNKGCKYVYHQEKPNHINMVHFRFPLFSFAALKIHCKHCKPTWTRKFPSMESWNGLRRECASDLKVCTAKPQTAAASEGLWIQ